MLGSIPLRICFLWHQHQPDYRTPEGFYLPWVRLHATKDYRDLASILRKHTVKHTINIVPSMLQQLDAYSTGTTDELQRLCTIAAAELTGDQKQHLAHWATTVQRDTMVSPLPRYNELFDELLGHSLSNLDEQAWRDVQVLVNLAWTGPETRRKNALCAELLLQGRNYNEEQKHALLQLHLDVMSDVVPSLISYEATGRCELSVTPYHHPILPLIIDSRVAAENMPHADLPNPPYQAVYHAKRHVARAIADWTARSGHAPAGMWPAEGSLSMAALDVMAEHGVAWTATDEDVLLHSLGPQWHQSEKFFPHVVATEHGEITVLFRDHALSDAIGFEYARWNPEHAADDFIRRLEERRRIIVAHHGEEALRNAVVSIILDGENCWEFYQNNGEDFLDALMNRCSDKARFESVTCSEAAASDGKRSLQHLSAGSWINGTFDIWIGSHVKNLAWRLLGEAKVALEGAGGSQDEVAQALETLEASDWFWWYDDRHQAPNKPDFDVNFRRHLLAIFEKCGVEPTVDLLRPLQEVCMTSELIRIPVVFGTAAMHRSTALVRDVSIESHEDWQRITVQLERRPLELEEVVLQIQGQDGFERACLISHDEFLWRSPHHDEGFEWLPSNAAVLYVHHHKLWTIKIMEERSEQGQISTLVHLSTP